MGPVGKEVVTEALVGTGITAASNMMGGAVGSLMKAVGGMMLLDAGMKFARAGSKAGFDASPST